MIAQHDLLTNIESTINELHIALLKFKSILDEEKIIIEKNRLGSLEENLLEKKTQVNHIQSIAAHFQILLNKNEEHENSVIHIIHLFPPEKKQILLLKWEEIREISKLCEQNNLTNGTLITILKNYNDAFLNLFSRRASEATYTNQSKKTIPPISTREHKA